MYYAATTDADRASIHSQAQAIRSNSDNSASTPQNSSTGQNANSILSSTSNRDSNGQAYMTASQWNSISTTSSDSSVVSAISSMSEIRNSSSYSSAPEQAKAGMISGIAQSFSYGLTKSTSDVSPRANTTPVAPDPTRGLGIQGTGNPSLKNEANYNIDEWWKNSLSDKYGVSDYDAALRRNIYGIGNDNDFADGLYNMLPKSVQVKIDDWREKNKSLASSNPDLFYTKYADQVLNFYDATKEHADMLKAMDAAIENKDPVTFIAVGIVYGGVTGAKTKIKAADLPTTGKIRYVPPETWTPSQPLPKIKSGGYIDRFGNEWVKGPSRTQGQSFEWDVQLSNTGKNQLGWASRDGAHVNVSLDGKITHK